jgi:hypothetical protein
MGRNIEVQFADGGRDVVFFESEDDSDIDLILRAWAILYQRDIQDWKLTSAPAMFFYEASRNYINRYDSTGYHDELVDVLEIARLRKELGK